MAAHVDDISCAGLEENLRWLFDGLSDMYRDHGRWMPRTRGGVLDRPSSLDCGAFKIKGDPKNSDILTEELEMEPCSGVDTPLTRDGIGQASWGEPWEEKEEANVDRFLQSYWWVPN